MKYSEKMQLLLKGIKMDEIKALEEQEAEEAPEDPEATEAPEDVVPKSALEAAEGMVKDLESKLQTKEDELSKLNAEFAKLNNKQTVADTPITKQTSTDVMKELFHPNKNKEV